jgi:uridine monophosphate synthetase
MVELAQQLLKIGAVQFGQFRLKSGLISPIYIDLRLLVSHPDVLRRVALDLSRIVQPLKPDLIAGVPLAGLPIATAVSLVSGIPMVYPREPKDHGTGKVVEGRFEPGQRVVLVDDLVTTGASKLEAVSSLRTEGLVVEDIVVVIDRRAGEAPVDGLRIHSLMTLGGLLLTLAEAGSIDWATLRNVHSFLASQR